MSLTRPAAGIECANGTFFFMLQIKNAGTTVTSIYMRFVNASMLCTCRARENQRFNWALLR